VGHLDEVEWAAYWGVFFIRFFKRLNPLPLINLHGPERFTLLLIINMSPAFSLLDLIVSFQLLVKLFLLFTVFIVN